MNQLVFKFPFAKKYFEQDFFVSSNNFSAYKLIENWPNWPGKWLNIFGTYGCGKTHLAKILEKKINKIKLIDAKNVDDHIVQELNNLDFLIGGLVFIGIKKGNKIIVNKCLFKSKKRSSIQKATVNKALNLILRTVK